MASQPPASSNIGKSQSLYPQVLESNPESHSPFLSNPSNPSRSSLYPSLDDSSPPNPNPNPSSSSTFYPSIEMKDIVEKLFPDAADDDDPKNPDAAPLLPPPVEETLLRIPGAILHLIDKQRSVELGAGDFTVVRLRQGENTVAVLARIGDNLVQWPLARDEAVVKLDDSHYFFSLHAPTGAAAAAAGADDDGSEDLLNYGLTFASKGQEGLLKDLDRILESYSSFSVQKVEAKGKSEVLDGSVAKEVTPAEVMGPKKEMMEERSAAYWTTLAPNVEDYSGLVAKAIAKGSGQLIKGILWCGDVTVDRLRWGEGLLKRRVGPTSKQTEVSKDALKRIKRFDLYPHNNRLSVGFNACSGSCVLGSFAYPPLFVVILVLFVCSVDLYMETRMGKKAFN